MTMNDQQQPQQKQEATLSSYVALRPLLFGAKTIQPGERVPLEGGRDYSKLLRLGDIAVAGDTGGQAAQQLATGTVAPQVARHPQRSNAKQFIELAAGPAYFISQDGASSRVMVLGFHSPSPEDTEELGIAQGGAVADVTFEGDSPTESPTRVNAARLLPLHPTEQLIEDLKGLDSDPLPLAHEAAAYGLGEGAPVYVISPDGERTPGTVAEHLLLTPEQASNIGQGFKGGERVVTVNDLNGQTLGMYPLTSVLPSVEVDSTLSHFMTSQAGAGAGADPAAAADLEEVRRELAYKTALLDAVTTEGSPLPEDLAAASKTALHKAHVKTLEGLVKLASGPDGLDNLVALPGIAEKSGRVIVDLLVSLGKLPAEAAQTEGA